MGKWELFVTMTGQRMMPGCCVASLTFPMDGHINGLFMELARGPWSCLGFSVMERRTDCWTAPAGAGTMCRVTVTAIRTMPACTAIGEVSSDNWSVLISIEVNCKHLSDPEKLWVYIAFGCVLYLLAFLLNQVHSQMSWVLNNALNQICWKINFGKIWCTCILS